MKMKLFPIALIGFLSSIIPILYNVNAIQKYPSQVKLHPLSLKISGSWYILMSQNATIRNCHQLNLTDTVAEESYFINNNIQLKYYTVDYIDDNTFAIGDNIFKIIYYCPTQDLLVVNNIFGNDILVLSQKLDLEDWEFQYIKVACKFKQFNCDNLYTYKNKCI